MAWVEEPGRDYVGNDVQVVTQIPYVDCAKACEADARCWVFTYVNVTDASGSIGECFLKNKKGTNIIWKTTRRNSGYIKAKGGHRVLHMTAAMEVQPCMPEFTDQLY